MRFIMGASRNYEDNTSPSQILCCVVQARAVRLQADAVLGEVSTIIPTRFHQHNTRHGVERFTAATNWVDHLLRLLRPQLGNSQKLAPSCSITFVNIIRARSGHALDHLFKSGMSLRCFRISTVKFVIMFIQDWHISLKNGD